MKIANERYPNQFQILKCVDFQYVGKSFLVFNFAMPMNTISGMLKWLKLIQYSLKTLFNLSKKIFIDFRIWIVYMKLSP